jgi:hypothetical protein
MKLIAAISHDNYEGAVSAISGNGASICTGIMVVRCNCRRYFGSQCMKFTQLGGRADLLSFYLELCIWPDVISRWIWQQVCIRFVEISEKVQWRPWQWLDKCFRKKAWAIHRKSKLAKTEERRDRWRAKSRACSSFCLTLRKLVANNSSCQAKQSIPHTTVMFYGYCVKIYEDFFANSGIKGTGCCIITMHHLTLPFSPGSFWPKQHDCHPTCILLFPFSLIEDKTESPPCWHSGGDWDRITGIAEHPHRPRLPGCI